MRIGIDALSVGNRSGSGVYTRQLVENLLAVDNRNEYVILWPDGLAHLPPPRASNAMIIRVRSFNPIARSIRSRLAFSPASARQFKLDLFHFPASVGPFLGPFEAFALVLGASVKGQARTVVTVHDLSCLRRPECFGFFRRNYYRAAIGRGAQVADAVIADSASTRSDLIELAGVAPERVSVVPLGVEPELRPVCDERTLQAVREKYSLPSQYLLFIGTIEPRKNIVRIIESYASIADKIPHQLVIAGRKGWKYHDVFKTVDRMQLRSRVHFTGRIEGSDVAAVYSLADVFVWPSLYEGFGLPVLEAMACGAPVVTSDCSSLPEVVGSAALVVDPFSTDEIARAIMRLIEDAPLRGELIAKGFVRASELTWRRTAASTLLVYEQLCAAGR
jgi:glycosyltransferase involved in cell wall biosynthesis